MEEGIKQAADLLSDMENEEYVRGMCELLARLFPRKDVETSERSEFFRAEIAKRVLA